MMDNEKIRQFAIKLLREIEIDKTETVDIDSTNYDDGSEGLTITVTYPAMKGGEVNE